MIRAGLFTLVLLIASTGLAAMDESETSKRPDHSKNWFIALGPAYGQILESGRPSNTGTKYNIAFGYLIPWSERVNLSVFYDGSYNTAAQGSDDFAWIGLGGTFFTKDRGANTSPFGRLELGHGGANAYMNSGPIIMGSIGYAFARAGSYTFNVVYRYGFNYTSETSRIINTQKATVPGNPTISMVRFEVELP